MDLALVSAPGADERPGCWSLGSGRELELGEHRDDHSGGNLGEEAGDGPAVGGDLANGQQPRTKRAGQTVRYRRDATACPQGSSEQDRRLRRRRAPQLTATMVLSVSVRSYRSQRACGMGTWTERVAAVRPRAVLTGWAPAEAARRVGKDAHPWRPSPATSASTGRASCGPCATTATRWWTTLPACRGCRARAGRAEPSHRDPADVHAVGDRLGGLGARSAA
jgi:hypothetical protein